MLTILKAGAIIGIEGYIVEVEVDISWGMPAFSIVGLPDNAVKESRERVKTAIINSGHLFPQERITINLAPAGIKKEGASFDLAIAAAIISTIYGLPTDFLRRYIVVGELALNGKIKPVKGILPLAITAREKKLEGIIVPPGNAEEAAAVEGIKVIAVEHVNNILDILRESRSVKYYEKKRVHNRKETPLCFSEVKGHEQAKRAIEIAASGGHNLLMIGSPGSGKSMLAKRIPTILPELEMEESIETTKIFSVAGLIREAGLIVDRPFRSPHHTISSVALVGGGVPPRPGEISLAHNGVLFLDELPEFQKNALEVLRQPLEDGRVTISRAIASVDFPASFMMVCAMNPCPCGYLFDERHPCKCTSKGVDRYQSKISGPLLDRMDMSIVVNSVPYRDLREKKDQEKSGDIKKRVEETRKIQKERFTDRSYYTNARMSAKDIEKFCALEEKAEKLLRTAMEKMGISTRGYSKILKVSRTIADLEHSAEIRRPHIAEAIQYYNNKVFNR